MPDSRCSFCTSDAGSVGTLVAGAGVFICDECVDLCAQLVKDKKAAGPAPRVPMWEQVDDEALLAHLPRIEAVRDQVDDDLRAWVAGARRRELSWDKIDAALGMKRQSAWERFAGRGVVAARTGLSWGPLPAVACSAGEPAGTRSSQSSSASRSAKDRGEFL